MGVVYASAKIVSINRLGRWLLAALPLLCASRTPAAPAAPEYTVKAVFIYQFTNFVRWPDKDFSSPDAPFVIGVLGPDPFDGALEAAVKDGHVGTHPIVVRHLTRESEAEHCHLLFVCPGEERVIRGHALSALTVGETAEFAAEGGDIRLANDRGRIKLQINLGAARAAGLNISSQLLRIAEVTHAN